MNTLTKRLAFGALLLCLIPPVCADDSDPASPVQLVDPFISTGGNRYVCGNNSPGANVPFGVVRLSPDTVSAFGATATNMSGYFYHDPAILGFSHTRLCGTGAVDGGHFRVMPGVASKPEKNLLRNPQLPFDHDQESASPGYYSVTFPSINVTAELTATQRVGLHRYTFPAGAVPRISLDVGSALGRGRSEACELHLLPAANEITGTARTFGSFSGRYGGLQVYFVARFRRGWKSVETWTGEKLATDQTNVVGDDVGAGFTFAAAKEQQTIELAVALSHVSIENARENLDQELAHKVSTTSAPPPLRNGTPCSPMYKLKEAAPRTGRYFTQRLYHTMIMPTVFNDVNGQYLGFDKQVHQTDGFEYYTDMSLWDTFRTTHPLYTLLTPERHRDMLVSLVKMAEQGGNLPRWPSGAGYTNSMFGAPAEVAIAEAYLKGIRDFDVETAYRVMRKAALEACSERCTVFRSTRDRRLRQVWLLSLGHNEPGGREDVGIRHHRRRHRSLGRRVGT